MIRHSECISRGFEKEVNKLYEVMKKNKMRTYRGFLTDHGGEFKHFTKSDVEKALRDLGAGMSTVPGRVWYEFWKNDWEEKFYNALSLIKD